MARNGSDQLMHAEDNAMRSNVWLARMAAAGVALSMIWAAPVPAESGKSKYAYPPTEKGDQVDDYHGTKINDPYRWLEDPDSDPTRRWVEAQNKLTFAYLDQIPARGRIKERLTKLWDYERYSSPVKHGDRYFFYKNDGLQNQ